MFINDRLIETCAHTDTHIPNFGRAASWNSKQQMPHMHRSSVGEVDANVRHVFAILYLTGVIFSKNFFSFFFLFFPFRFTLDEFEVKLVRLHAIWIVWYIYAILIHRTAFLSIYPNYFYLKWEFHSYSLDFQWPDWWAVIKCDLHRSGAFRIFWTHSDFNFGAAFVH